MIKGSRISTRGALAAFLLALCSCVSSGSSSFEYLPWGYVRSGERIGMLRGHNRSLLDKVANPAGGERDLVFEPLHGTRGRFGSSKWDGPRTGRASGALRSNRKESSRTGALWRRRFMSWAAGYGTNAARRACVMPAEEHSPYTIRPRAKTRLEAWKEQRPRWGLADALGTWREKDGGVAIEGQNLVDADPLTFSMMERRGCLYGIDDRHVYFERKLIEGADPASFVMIAGDREDPRCFAYDRLHQYQRGELFQPVILGLRRSSDTYPVSRRSRLARNSFSGLVDLPTCATTDPPGQPPFRQKRVR